MAVDAPLRTLYRNVKTNPPRLAEFMSAEARGRPLRNETPHKRCLWSGLSVFATEAQASAIARDFPGVWSYVATVELPDDAPVRIEKTLGPGHYTIWGDPSYLLGCVASVAPLTLRYTSSMRYELWDLDSGNLIGAYVSEAEALADARSELETGVDPMPLGLRAGIDESGEEGVATLPPPLRGPELVARILGRDASRSDQASRARRSA